MEHKKSRIQLQWRECEHGLDPTHVTHVDKGGVLLVKGCDRTPHGLLALSSHFGHPMEKLKFKHKFGIDPIFRYAGNVSLKHELPKAERMDTNDNEKLTAHTARSYCIERPLYFALIRVEI